jgi:hypothetical protein
MLCGMPLSGVAMICRTTFCASVRRSVSFALSDAANDETELATIANPHAITVIRFIVFMPFTF